MELTSSAFFLSFFVHPTLCLSVKKVYTNGRPAWYDQDGALRSPFVVGVAGGSASGELRRVTGARSRRKLNSGAAQANRLSARLFSTG
jgi:hypothetical protein